MGKWINKITPDLGITYVGGWCLKAVRNAFNLPAIYSTAIADWKSGETNPKSTRLGNHDGELPPLGVYVPVYFALGNEPAGHIAISMPDGRVASSTQSGTHQGLYIHPNLQHLVDMYGKYNGGCTYLGWSQGTENTGVVKYQEEAIVQPAPGIIEPPKIEPIIKPVIEPIITPIETPKEEPIQVVEETPIVEQDKPIEVVEHVIETKPTKFQLIIELILEIWKFITKGVKK